MFEKSINSLPIWYFENLSKFKEIYHFVSTRKGGFSSYPYQSLNLGFTTGDDPQKILKNRELLAMTLGIPLNNFITAKQIHGGNVTIISKEMRGRGAVDYEKAINATDAMVTNIQNNCIMVFSADCVPILFFDPTKRVIGAAHAGWRGTIRLIAQNVVKTLMENFNCDPSDVLVGIGPSIGPCCYEIGPEVIAQIESIFHDKENYVNGISPEGKGYFNLWEANKAQLLQFGILEKNIEIASMCTYCHADIFFSERHQRGKTGIFGVGIMLN